MTNEPAFLRKLRSQHGTNNSGRHERPIARPRKQTVIGDQDDEPTYVVEDSQNTMSREQYDALIKDNQPETGDKRHSAEHGIREKSNGADTVTTKNDVLGREQTTLIGGSNKRRQAKKIGRDDEKDDGAELDSQRCKKQLKSRKNKKVTLCFDQEADVG
ncbi:MAG: hypothetical protein Q9164_003390 [Protoblastenia rupestris]